jgi:hypothetical protein
VFIAISFVWVGQILTQEQQRLKLRTVELNLKKLQQREQKLQQLLNKSERHTKIKEAQAEEAARLKLVRVNLLRDMKQEDKRWRLQMKEKEKTKLEFTATNLRLHNLQQQEIESQRRQKSLKNRLMAKEKKQKHTNRVKHKS